MAREPTGNATHDNALETAIGLQVKAYRVDLLKRFADRINVGSSYVLEICFLTQRAGGRVIQIPVSCEDWRRSKFNLLHEAWYKYSNLGRLWLRSRRSVT